MSLTIVATPGSASANSYLTLPEAETYFETRLFADVWNQSQTANKNIALVMATRTLDTMLMGTKMLVAAEGRSTSFYRVNRAWTGIRASATQALAWPRAGMFDGNGNAIAETAVPQALKNAVAEFAMQMLSGDRTADNDVIVQGLTSLRAGSVSLGFKSTILPQVIPDAVANLLVPSWVTPEKVQAAIPAMLTVAGPDRCTSYEPC